MWSSYQGEQDYILNTLHWKRNKEWVWRWGDNYYIHDIPTCSVKWLLVFSWHQLMLYCIFYYNYSFVKYCPYLKNKVQIFLFCWLGLSLRFNFVDVAPGEIIDISNHQLDTIFTYKSRIPDVSLHVPNITGKTAIYGSMNYTHSLKRRVSQKHHIHMHVFNSAWRVWISVWVCKWESERQTLWANSTYGWCLISFSGC